MPSLVLSDVQAKLQMRTGKTTIIRRLNDRPNIYFTVEEMKYSAKSMLDLERILNLDGKMQPPPFMVFVNKQAESEELAKMGEPATRSLRKGHVVPFRNECGVS
jgi:superfamily II DNA helicase RecQ